MSIVLSKPNSDVTTTYVLKDYLGESILCTPNLEDIEDYRQQHNISLDNITIENLSL